MKPLFDCASSRELDERTRIGLALSDLQLMEKASLRLWDVLFSRFPDFHAPVTALCGKGDNGADALAMLRHAGSAGFDRLTALVSSKAPGNALAAQLDSLEAMGIEVIAWSQENVRKIGEILACSQLVLDGIAGTGITGEARDECKDMICALNQVKIRTPSLKIVSIDLPSGLSDEWQPGWECVKADLTLALEPAKAICFDPEGRIACGEILPVRDVFPVSLLAGSSRLGLIDGDSSDLDPIPASGRDYKMSRGRVAIFAGSVNSPGAAVLCAKAAAASGAGYVTLHVDKPIHAAIAHSLESFVVMASDPNNPEPGPCDVVLVGPGWGRGVERAAQLAAILSLGIPTVLDADALRLLAGNPSILAPVIDRCVLTPHPGELADLTGALNIRGLPFLRSILEASRLFHSILVSKSHVTWVADAQGNASAWDGMLPELGTSGSGDILAGLVAGFSARALARNKRSDPQAFNGSVASILYRSAIKAVAVHGMAGRRTAEEKGYFEATDLLPACAKIAREV